MIRATHTTPMTIQTHRVNQAAHYWSIDACKRSGLNRSKCARERRATARPLSLRPLIRVSQWHDTRTATTLAYGRYARGPSWAGVEYMLLACCHGRAGAPLAACFLWQWYVHVPSCAAGWWSAARRGSGGSTFRVSRSHSRMPRRLAWSGGMLG